MRKQKIVSGILGICISITSFITPIHAQETFDSFKQEMFVDMMEEDYMSMHFALKDYQKYGIEKPEVMIGKAKWDYEESVEEYEDTLKELYAFDYDTLSDTEKADYKTIEFYLKQNIELNKYPYFDWAFSSSEGVIDNILTMLTEFTFYHAEDIDDYVTVLKSVPSFLQDCLDITKKQAEKGYFLTDTMLQDTLDSIDKFVSKTDDNQLIVIFDENIDAFQGLTSQQIQNYKQENKQIVLEQIIPAYENVATTLQQLKGSRKGGYSVASLQDGKAYYQALAQYKTSLNMSVEEMLDLCTTYITQCVQEIATVEQTNPSALQETIELQTPEEILTYLENHLEDFPTLQKVQYKASYLDQSVANDSVVAYYLNPPIDDIQDNVIKINGSNVSNAIDLYSTLAHEGFPGHLYQNNYYMQQNPSPIRTQLTMMGYQEGWGMYAEMQALDFSSLSKDAATYQKYSTALSYTLNAAIDLGVNGLDWSINDVKDYLDNLYLNTSLASSLYNYVTSQPGLILPYGVGVAMYGSLQKKAENALGNAFHQKEFNTVLLENGDRPFAVVEEDVNTYLGIANTDSNNITAHNDQETHTQDSQQVNWLVYGSVGGVIGLVGIVALIGVHKYRKDNPFQS